MMLYTLKAFDTSDIFDFFHKCLKIKVIVYAST